MQAVGDIGLVLAGVGIIMFTLLFGVSVRWWSDWMGRIIFSFFGSMAVIMGFAVWRVIGLPLSYVQLWRAVLFGTMAVSIWGGVIAFVWAQFVQRRVRSGRKTPTDEGTTPQ